MHLTQHVHSTCYPVERLVYSSTTYSQTISIWPLYLKTTWAQVVNSVSSLSRWLVWSRLGNFFIRCCSPVSFLGLLAWAGPLWASPKATRAAKCSRDATNDVKKGYLSEGPLYPDAYDELNSKSLYQNKPQTTNHKPLSPVHRSFLLKGIHLHFRRLERPLGLQSPKEFSDDCKGWNCVAHSLGLASPPIDSATYASHLLHFQQPSSPVCCHWELARLRTWLGV